MARKHPHDVHAQRRFKERYGLQLTKQLKLNLLSKIRKGETVSKRLTNTRTLHIIELGGLEIEVIYSKRTKKIVTVLPPEVNSLE